MKWITSRKWAAAVAAAAFLFEKGQYKFGTIVTLGWMVADVCEGAFGKTTFLAEQGDDQAVDPDAMGH